MPRERELPRREIPAKTEKILDQKLGDIETKRSFRVGENPKNRAAKPRRELPGDLLVDINDSLSKASTALRSLSLVRRGFLDKGETARWQERVSRYRGDLCGFWNDIKADVAGRVNEPSATTADDGLINSAADLLEAAERAGGLSGWLDRWKDAVVVPVNERSWEELSEVANGVRGGIEFCTVVVDEAFGGVSPKGSRTDLHLALEAIAAEVVREVEAFRTLGRMGVAGTEFEAVKDRLKAQDRRAGVEERLHQAWGTRAKGLGAACVAEFPGMMRGADKLRSAANLIEGWRSQAAEIQEYIGTTDVDPADIRHAAGTLDAASEALANKLLDMSTIDTSWSGADDLGTTRHSNACFVLRQVAIEIRDQQLKLASQVADPQAKSALTRGKGRVELDSAINLIEAYDQHQNTTSIYGAIAAAREVARKVAANPSFQNDKNGFGVLSWTDPCAYALGKLRDQSFSGYDPALAARFEKEIVSEGGLVKTLDRWGLRQPKDTYGLSWDLVAKLRDHKRRIEAMFPVSSPLREFLGFSLDAVTGVVASDLKREAPGPV